MTTPSVKLVIASDHAGYEYKERIKTFLTDRGYQVKDFGTDSEQSVDYPLFIRPAAEAVANGNYDQGIILGGSGNGEAMVANKVKGIRCAVCWNLETARLAREHNNANMISIGQRLTPLETALTIVNTWLTGTFEGGRHERRILQMAGQES
jgi:ribose 5-phosphate isomerase B